MSFKSQIIHTMGKISFVKIFIIVKIKSNNLLYSNLFKTPFSMIIFAVINALCFVR